ncbi:MAG: hypothetical protein UU98_C0011G0030 [Parcubacteria group bacterium GW2011_GWD2_42_14]|nr:MAG: hypothetical protein UU98_C0011G0030 [Parcubacteria group bacterium GW2011_GWD2_42_14]
MLTSKKGEEIVTQEKKGATKTQICFVFMLSILDIVKSTISRESIHH